jgi:hypothetical protein
MRDMHLHIVNPDPKYPRARLLDATTLGYLYLAVSVRPPRGLPFVMPSMKRGRVFFPNGIEPAPPRRRRVIRRCAYDLVADPRWFARLARDISKAPIRVPIAAVLPLARAAEADRRLARGHILGRMLLRVRRAPRSRLASRRKG